MNGVRGRLAAVLLGAVLVAAGCTESDRTTGRPQTTSAPPSSPLATRSAAYGITCLQANERAAAFRFRVGHERGSNLCEWVPIARDYARLGYRVLVFDFHDQDHLDLDVIAAAAELRRRGVTRVVLVGSSMGGTAALVAAGRIRPAVAGVVSLPGAAVFGGMDARTFMLHLRVPALFMAARRDGPFATAALGLYGAAATRGPVRAHTPPVYSDADAAALYDRLNPWGPSDDFYLSYVMAAPSVLDVGCGTGMLLHRARESGHTGRLCGVDPDLAALERARRRASIEWVLGTAAEMTWDREFDLAVMASNVFQVFVTDQEVGSSLAATRAALADGGRLVFGTRNPLVRAWEGWNPSNPIDVVDHAGRELRVSYQVEPVTGDVVTLTETTATRAGEPLRVDRTRLRFLDADGVDRVLGAAGFEVEARYGDWSRGPFSETSENIVTVARAASSSSSAPV